MLGKGINLVTGKSLQPALVMRAFFVLACVRFGLCLTPSRTMRIIQTTKTQSKKIILIGRSASASLSATEISDSVRLLSRYLPKCTCLTQALAGKYLLAKNGYHSKLKIGVTNPQDFRAHAWLEHNNTVLLGKVSNLADYTALKD